MGDSARRGGSAVCLVGRRQCLTRGRRPVDLEVVLPRGWRPVDPEVVLRRGQAVARPAERAVVRRWRAGRDATWQTEAAQGEEAQTRGAA